MSRGRAKRAAVLRAAERRQPSSISSACGCGERAKRVEPPAPGGGAPGASNKCRHDAEAKSRPMNKDHTRLLIVAAVLFLVAPKYSAQAPAADLGAPSRDGLVV